jgi:hypothetical protein
MQGRSGSQVWRLPPYAKGKGCWFGRAPAFRRQIKRVGIGLMSGRVMHLEVHIDRFGSAAPGDADPLNARDPVTMGSS